MAHIRPYRYWVIMSDSSHFAYQLEENGTIYKVYDARKKYGKYVCGDVFKKETISLEEMLKLKAYHDYGVLKETTHIYVDVPEVTAWCVAKRRGLHVLRDAYDREIASNYKHCDSR